MSLEYETPDGFTRCAAIVDLQAVRANVRRLKQPLSDKTGLLAVVKADAYGHGAAAVSKAALDAGAAILGVATAQEGALLRANGIDAPILCLGVCLAGALPLAVRNRLILTVCDVDGAKEAAAAARAVGDSPASFHFKVDTGMSRLGPFAGDAALAQIEEAARVDGAALVGVYSHLSDSEAPDGVVAHTQAERFAAFLAALRARGIDAPAHVSNSGAAMRFREMDWDIVRAGIAVYGLSSSAAAGFAPALSLRARVAYVKTIPVGATVGYGQTFTASRETRVAVVTFGYADGYPRRLSNKADVLLRGRRVHIIGSVCMDQMMVDATESGAEVGDAVTLIGADGGAYIGANELAELAGTIPYEIVTQIGARVPRVYI